MSPEAVFRGLLLLGIGALVAGVGLTRLHWRSDIAPFGLHTRSLDVMLHPGRYTKGAPLGTIRSLNIAGAMLLAGAAGIVVYELVRSVPHP
jgi:hypothetical protein